MFCPRCKEKLQLPSHCVCGWRVDPNPKKGYGGGYFCVGKNEDGSFCQNVPVTTVDGDWFCRAHNIEKEGYNIPKAPPEFVAKCLAEMYKSVGKIHKARKVLQKAVTAPLD